MHHPDDDNRRAFARCEEQWLREPAWRTGEDEPEDDDDRATPYAVSAAAMPADDADVIPF